MLNKQKAVQLFLRIAIALGFLSAVADRLGIIWGKSVMVWGNWENFLSYTQSINPWLPTAIIPAVGIVVTALEIIFALLLLVGFKTKWVALFSGCLLLVFALSMTFSTSIKSAFDYSVFIASAGAFALSVLAKSEE